MDNMTMAILGFVQSSNEMRKAWISMDGHLTMIANGLRQRDATLITLARLYPKLSTEEIILAAAEQMKVDRGPAQ